MHPTGRCGFTTGSRTPVCGVSIERPVQHIGARAGSSPRFGQSCRQGPRGGEGRSTGWDPNAQTLATLTDLRGLPRRLKAEAVRGADERTTGPANVVVLGPDANHHA